ncbi:MAG: DNA repair protein RecO [Candidatus Omnitrophica bacterium]|nr:DNA repair protein RecO [Candidatus Omnitrophota bacterium]
MPETKTTLLTAIPLAKFEAKSGSHVLSFFTWEQGQIRAIVRTARGKKKPSVPLLPLFSTYEILFAQPRQADGLYELKERETVTGRPKLNSGTPLEPWAAASVLSELLLRTTEKEDPHPYLFSMLDKALDCMENDHSPAILLTAFLVKFLEHMGYRPRWESPEANLSERKYWWFDPALGGLFTQKEIGRVVEEEERPSLRKPTRTSSEEIAIIHRFRLSKFEEIEGNEAEVATAKKWVPLLGDYVEYHLETRLKSLDFWKEIQPKRK